jgi:PAS domain S-box-containing protein
LLVEDEALIDVIERQILKKHGFNVIIVSTGEKAIEITKTTLHIDLILMDINLGEERMDGTEAAEIILRERDIPVLFLSNYIQPEALQKTEKIASYGYVVKDSGETVLITSIKMAFKLYEANRRLKEREESLRQSEEKYRSLFENAAEGIFQTTPEGHFLSANPAQAKLFGYDSSREFMEQIINISRLHYVNPKDLETYKNILETKGVIKRFEVQLLTRQGNPVWASINACAIRNDEGAIIYYEGTAEDITSRKQAEEERGTLIIELKDALSQVKTLSGLLPICSSCKKIRNDKGSWEQIETYIRDRLEVDFTHSICPECTERLYPELHKKK